MKRITTIVAAALFLFLTACSSTPDQITMIDTASSGVVQIRTDTGTGSGFFINADTIVTNYHVIAKAPTLRLRGRDSAKVFEATLVGSDELADVAVLRITDIATFAKLNRYRPLVVNETGKIMAGQVVWAIGHPWGEEWSVSRGIISHVSRRVQPLVPRYLIQTDANIFPGNSGGPLINERGEVIGLNTLMLTKGPGGSYGMSTVAPIVMKVVRNILAEKPVTWPQLGVVLNDDENGISVTGVNTEVGSGLQEKDVLKSITTPRTKLPITIHAMDDFRTQLPMLNEGDVIRMGVLRDGKLVEVTAVLKGMPSSYYLKKLAEQEAEMRKEMEERKKRLGDLLKKRFNLPDDDDDE